MEELEETHEEVVTSGNVYEFTLAASADEVIPAADAGGAGHRLRAGQLGLRAV